MLLQSLPTAGRIDTASPDILSSFAPKLIDFGLAKLEEDANCETRPGDVLGTPEYMSPEQASGRLNQIGPATDVYGLGTILYELLAGCPVFRGSNDADSLRKVVFEEPISPGKHRGDLPPDLEAICLKCLQKDPSGRYPSPAAFAADLRRFINGESTEAKPLTLPGRLHKWVRRQPA